MVYKTINVSPQTYQRLLLYKHAGMSFDAVINEMINLIPEDEFYKEILEEHRKRMARIRAGEYASSEELDRALDET